MEAVLMQLPREQWIMEVDARLAREGIMPSARPFRAIREWASETKSVGIGLTGPEAIAIFDWYRTHYPHEGEVGSAFTGAIYYEGKSWPLLVPHSFGQVRIKVLAMVDAPAIIVGRMAGDVHALELLRELAADCIDYGYGCTDALRLTDQTFAGTMYGAADRQLRAGIDVLLSSRPTHKAAEAAAMAVEMFFKSYLARHDNLDEARAKRLGHDLDRLCQNCLALGLSSDLSKVRPDLVHLPGINSRYEARLRDEQAWFRAIRVAQAVGAIATRDVTGRDCRSTMLEQK